MAATAQAVRPISSSKEKSFLHTKRILAIAISSIAYVRQLFPDDSFRDRKVVDMPVRILRKDRRTAQLIDWMTGVYDALEKEYLKKLILVISYKDEVKGKNILETYTFSFAYKDAHISTDVEMMRDGHPVKATPMTAEDTKKSAQNFMRKLVALVSSFDTIKSAFSITMRLTYYDDRRPADYQPVGFEAVEDDEFEINEEISRTNVGKMYAPFHTMQLDVTESCGKLKDVSPDKRDSQMHLHIASGASSVEVETELPRNDRALSHDQNTQPTPMSQTENTQGLGVRCPCGYQEDDGVMLMCVSCKYWQHAICFCLTEDIGLPYSHFCNICGDASNTDLYPTDVTLTDVNENQLQEICMWRRALLVCYGTTRVNVTTLSRRLSCTKLLAKSMIQKLVVENVAKPVKGHPSFKDIDKVSLDAVFYRDVKKMALDMRKQNVEAKANILNKGTPKIPKPLAARDNDETPLKMDASPRDCRSAKRRLGIDSQDSAVCFRPPNAPSKARKKTRCK